MVICLEQGADLHMALRISLPLTVSCFSKIQICFTFLVLAHPGSPGQRAVKRVCVYLFIITIIIIIILYIVSKWDQMNDIHFERFDSTLISHDIQPTKRDECFSHESVT